MIVLIKKFMRKRADTARRELEQSRARRTLQNLYGGPEDVAVLTPDLKTRMYINAVWDDRAAQHDAERSMDPEYAEIQNGRLVIGYAGCTAYDIGINQARKDLAQIECSQLKLKASTIARRDVLRKAIALWEARAPTA